MVEHVRRRALRAGIFSDVIVATCDDVIFNAVEKHGGRVIMTARSHVAATDRVAEAVQKLDCTHVVNIQGDEILVLPEDLRNIVNAINASAAPKAWNAIAPIESAAELSDRSIVKCTVSLSGRIMACARDLSRLSVSPPTFEPVRKILGIIAFERQFLDQYGAMTRTPVETAESIDQSRIVEHDILLQGVPFTRGYPGINEPREVALVEELLKSDARQREALREILY